MTDTTIDSNKNIVMILNDDKVQEGNKFCCVVCDPEFSLFVKFCKKI